MDRLSKHFTLFLVVILAVSSMLMIKPTDAQTIPKPSVPEFTLNFVDKSHDVYPTPTSTIDPYNNRTITREFPSYHVRDHEIEVTIKNQPYPSIVNGNVTNLYYLVGIKGHFENWTEASPKIESTDNLYLQSNSEYTKLLFSANSYSSDYQIDFRVKAVLGYTYNHYLPDHIVPIPASDFLYEESDWSITQTFMMSSIPESNSPTPTAPVISTDPLIGIVLIISLVASLCVIILLLYIRRLKRRIKAATNH